MTDEEAPVSGWAYVAFAAGMALLSVLVLVVDDGPPKWIGFVLLGAASLLGAVGAAAVGVTVGLRRADWLRQH